MRVKMLLIFFITITCSATLPGKGFAEDVKESVSATNNNAMTIRADGFQKINLRDSLGGDSDIHHTGTESLGLPRSNAHVSVSRHTLEVSKVLSVIEKRVGDQKLVKKIKDKLPTVSEERLHMLASLSERIADDKQSAKTEIAFLLLTTLIIFS